MFNIIIRKEYDRIASRPYFSSDSIAEDNFFLSIVKKSLNFTIMWFYFFNYLWYFLILAMIFDGEFKIKLIFIWFFFLLIRFLINIFVLVRSVKSKCRSCLINIFWFLILRIILFILYNNCFFLINLILIFNLIFFLFIIIVNSWWISFKTILLILAYIV